MTIRLVSAAAAVAAALVLVTAAPATAAPPAPRDVTAYPFESRPWGTTTVFWMPPVPGDGSLYLIYRDLPDGTKPFVGSTTDEHYHDVPTGQNAGAAGLCFRVQRLIGGEASGMSAMGCGSAVGTSGVRATGPLTVVPIGPGRMYVSWQRPEPNDGSTYEVHKVKHLNAWTRMAVVGDVYSTHVTGLEAGVQHCFNVVRIKNGVRSGWSPGGCAVMH